MTTSLIAGFEALCDRQFDDIARAGVWWTGEEKLAMAAVARAAMTDRTAPQTVLGDAALEATRKVAAAASSLRKADIERWEAEGMRVEAYVELVGVVGRLAARHRRLRTRVRPAHRRHRLPGHRSKQPCPASTMSTAGYPPPALRSRRRLHGGPGATELWIDVSSVLYMPLEEMGDPTFVRDGATRAQIELVAARTSYLNDCFY